MGIQNIHILTDPDSINQGEVVVINPETLRREMFLLLNMIDAQIDEVKKQADEMGCRPEQVQNPDGSWALSPLLLAKVQAVSTLAQLNEPRPRRSRSDR